MKWKQTRIRQKIKLINTKVIVFEEKKKLTFSRKVTDFIHTIGYLNGHV